MKQTLDRDEVETDIDAPPDAVYALVADVTRVVESYEVKKPIMTLGWFIIGTLFGDKDRSAVLRKGMKQTLERIRAAAEMVR